MPVLSALREWKAARDLTWGTCCRRRRHGRRSTPGPNGSSHQGLCALSEGSAIGWRKTKSGIERTFDPGSGADDGTEFRQGFDGRYLDELTTDELANWLAYHDNP